MGTRVGVIFHDNWQNFSPLLYSHYGADLMQYNVEYYLKDYLRTNPIVENMHDGHKYEPSHMMFGFINYIAMSHHMRIENLCDNAIQKLKTEHSYPNCFEGGCLLVNISKDNFGGIKKD